MCPRAFKALLNKVTSVPNYRHARAVVPSTGLNYFSILLRFSAVRPNLSEYLYYIEVCSATLVRGNAKLLVRRLLSRLVLLSYNNLWRNEASAQLPNLFFRSSSHISVPPSHFSVFVLIWFFGQSLPLSYSYLRHLFRPPFSSLLTSRTFLRRNELIQTSRFRRVSFTVLPSSASFDYDSSAFHNFRSGYVCTNRLLTVNCNSHSCLSLRYLLSKTSRKSSRPK